MFAVEIWRQRLHCTRRRCNVVSIQCIAEMTAPSWESVEKLRYNLWPRSGNFPANCWLQFAKALSHFVMEMWQNAPRQDFEKIYDYRSIFSANCSYTLESQERHYFVLVTIFFSSHSVIHYICLTICDIIIIIKILSLVLLLTKHSVNRNTRSIFDESCFFK